MAPSQDAELRRIRGDCGPGVARLFRGLLSMCMHAQATTVRGCRLCVRASRAEDSTPNARLAA